MTTGSCMPPRSKSCAAAMKPASQKAFRASLTSGIMVTLRPSKVGSLASALWLCGANFSGDPRRRFQRSVEGLARVLGEARPPGQRRNVQQFVENELEVPAVEQLRHPPHPVPLPPDLTPPLSTTGEGRCEGGEGDQYGVVRSPWLFGSLSTPVERAGGEVIRPLRTDRRRPCRRRCTWSPRRT
jgi:hypothetical protein